MKTNAGKPDAKTSNGRRGRPSPQESARITCLILTEAKRLFLADGYDKVSMEAVARATTMPKSTLYKRYSDKAALLRAVIDDQVTQWSAISAQRDSLLGDTLEDRLAHHLATMLVWGTKPEVRKMNHLYSSISQTSESGLGEPVFRGYREMQELLVASITEHGPRQEICAREPDRVAHFLMASVAGLLAMRGSDQAIDEREARATADWLVGVAVRGAAAW